MSETSSMTITSVFAASSVWGPGPRMRRRLPIPRPRTPEYVRCTNRSRLTTDVLVSPRE